MKTLIDVIEAAKIHSGFKSDRELSRALGRSDQVINQYRRKNVLPDDDSMRALARLAEIDENAALLMLNIWRANSPESKQVYRNILAKISGTAAALATGAYIWPALSDQASAAEIISGVALVCILCDIFHRPLIAPKSGILAPRLHRPRHVHA